MGVVEIIFITLTAAVQAFGTMIGKVFESAISVVYSETGGLTVLGTLMLIGVAAGLFFFAFRWVRSLIKMRG